MSSDDQSDQLRTGGGTARTLPDEDRVENPIDDDIQDQKQRRKTSKKLASGSRCWEGGKREVNEEEELELELERELDPTGVRTTAARWVAHPMFDSIVMVLILANCVQLAMYNPLEPEDSGLNLLLGDLDTGFTVAFTLELLLKMIGLGPMRYFQDGFNWLDFLCVAIGWVSIVPGGGDTGGLSAIRSLRVLRPLRTMSSFPGLRVIVQTILASLPMCGVVLLLAMYLFCIFAIFGVQSFAGVLKHRCVTTASIAVYETSGNLRDLDFDNDEMCTTYRSEKIWKGHFCDEGFECMKVVNPNYGVTNFDSLLPALLLIFQVVTLEGWTPIMYWTADCTTGWVVIYYLLIVFSGSFYVLNLGLAVVSSSHEDSQHEEEEAQHAAEESSAAGGPVPMSPARRRMKEAEEAEAKQEKARQLTGVRKYMHDVVQSDQFTNFVTACILFNTIVLAINYYGASKTYQDVLEAMNTVCTFVFLVEMVMKMSGLGWEYWYDSFNVFDTIVNLTSLAMFLLQAFSSSGSISSLSALRAVRILRVLKLMKRAESLQNFIAVLFATVSELGNFCAVVALVIIIFALLGMQFFGGQFHLTDNWPEEDIYPRANFDSFGWALITVFQILTGEDWNSVMYYGIKATGYGATIYFISLLMVGDFIVMNLFIAILLSSFEKHRLIITETKELEKAKEAANANANAEGGGDDPASTTIPEGTPARHKELGLESQLSHESGSITSEEHDYTTAPGSLVDVDGLCILTPEEEGEEAERQLEKVIAAEQSWKPLAMYELKSMWLFASDHPVRKAAYAVCTTAWFERIVLTLIFVSGLTMTLESPGIDDDPNWKRFFFVSNNVFTAVFTAELLIKVTAFGLYGEPGSYLSESWSILDGLVVLVSLSLLLLDDMPGLSSIRVMRVLRVGRPLRMIQRFPELRLVVQALVGSLKALGNVIVIATLFWSIFAILGMAFFMGKYNYCTDPAEAITKATCVGLWVPDAAFPTVTEVREWRTHDNNFDNFYNAVTTLFEMSTTEGWVDVMLNGVDAVAEDKNPKRNYNEPMSMFFIVFMVFAYFLIVNLFVGIIMDNFAEKRDELKGKVFMTPRQEEWVATMKASWKEKVEKTPEFESRWRARIYDFVVSSNFQFFIAACIAINVCVLASFHEGQTKGWTAFQTMSDDVFLLIFAIECVLKIVAFNPIKYLQSGWNVFDFTVVVLLSITFFTGVDFNTSVLRILRITRLLRLVRGMKSFVKLFDMLITSAPTLLNVGALLFIVFFVYAVAGMQLFGDVNRHQEFLNQSSNFSNFGSSLMILMRMVTGESWNGVMYDCMVQPPFCDNDNNPNYDNGCGSKGAAYLYFLSFTLLGSWIMLNLFLAVVMENYESSGDDSKVIDEYDMEDFKTEWMKIDKRGEGVIGVTSLRALLMQLNPPMGSCGSTEGSILNVEVPLSGKHSELVTFYDVLNAIINHVYRNNSEKLPYVVEGKLNEAQDKFLGKMRGRCVRRIRSGNLKNSQSTFTILPLPILPESDVDEGEPLDRKVAASAMTSVTMSATVTIQTVFREAMSRQDVRTSLPLLQKATEEVMASGLVDMSHEHLFWDALEGRQPTAQEDARPTSPYKSAHTNSSDNLGTTLTIPSDDLSFLDVYLTPKSR